jgi:hypothetical protein
LAEVTTLVALSATVIVFTEGGGVPTTTTTESETVDTDADVPRMIAVPAALADTVPSVATVAIALFEVVQTVLLPGRNFPVPS